MSDSPNQGARHVERPLISICVCTFRRQQLLSRLLESILVLEGSGVDFDWSCIVVDNDSEGSASSIVKGFADRGRGKFFYDIEPRRSFALVRNKTLSLATGDFIAFIDDDEYPSAAWLLNLLKTQRQWHADGVLGPVRPYFDVTPPRWLTKSALCERPAHPTGMIMPWEKSRTGNVLFRRSLVTTSKLLFDPAFANGGEDVDFFKRAARLGCRFVWCEEAPAFELVPKERLSALYFIKRGTMQGQISLRYSADKLTKLSRATAGLHSFCALSAYFILLPFLFIFNAPIAMRFLVKCSHHWGRLFAAIGMPLMQRRSF